MSAAQTIERWQLEKHLLRCGWLADVGIREFDRDALKSTPLGANQVFETCGQLRAENRISRHIGFDPRVVISSGAHARYAITSHRPGRGAELMRQVGIFKLRREGWNAGMVIVQSFWPGRPGVLGSLSLQPADSHWWRALRRNPPYRKALLWTTDHCAEATEEVLLSERTPSRLLD